MDLAKNKQLEIYLITVIYPQKSKFLMKLVIEDY